MSDTMKCPKCNKEQPAKDGGLCSCGYHFGMFPQPKAVIINRACPPNCLEQARADERSRLAAQAPEGAQIEIDHWLDEFYQYTNPGEYPPYNSTEIYRDRILAAVWPIFQAKLEAERERALKYLQNVKSKNPELKLDDAIFALEFRIQCIKSGKQEAKS